MSHRSATLSLSFLILAAAAAPSLQGCVVAAAGAGASAGYQLSEQRSFKQQIDDTAAQAAITTSWRQYEPKISENCSATVYDGRALLTGRVPNEQWHQIALKLAYQQGVRQVYDEIRVGPGETFIRSAGDGVISTKLKTALLTDGDIRSVNYVVTTVEGVVYLMGVARSRAELDDVISHARNTEGVRNVVSFVRVGGSGAPPVSRPAMGAPPPPPPPPPLPPPESSAPEPPPPPAPPHQLIQSTPLQ